MSKLHCRLLTIQSACVCLMLVGFLISLPFSAMAHNVVSGVYADGMVIEGEIGYSNGDMAEAGSVVTVLDANGELLTELVLEEGGSFIYEAKTATQHVFKANLSAGHVAEMIVEADELHPPMGQILPIATPMSSEPEAVTEAAEVSSKAVLNNDSEPKAVPELPLERSITIEQLETIVRSAVAQQVRPLQKELTAYKEKVMLRDIAGGLGFIFGLFGVAAWVASRREKGEKNAAVS